MNAEFNCLSKHLENFFVGLTMAECIATFSHTFNMTRIV